MKSHQSLVLLLGALAISTQFAHVSGLKSSQRQYHLRALGDKADDDSKGHDHKVCTITKESQCDGENWSFSTCCVDDKYECRWDKRRNVKRCQKKKKNDDDDCSEDKDEDHHPGKGDHHHHQQGDGNDHKGHDDDDDMHGSKPDHGDGGKDSDDWKPDHGQHHGGGGKPDHGHGGKDDGKHDHCGHDGKGHGSKPDQKPDQK